jgi:small subunit ribosomal protein S11
MATTTETTKKSAKPKGKAATGKRKKKVKKNVSEGIVHIHATFNNTIITVTDKIGDVICWSSAGNMGFKGSKKSTPFAAQMASEEVAKRAQENGVRSVVVYVKGPGAGRETALKALGHAGLRVQRIQDVTPIPHNGCRPPKKRRV